MAPPYAPRLTLVQAPAQEQVPALKTRRVQVPRGDTLLLPPGVAEGYRLVEACAIPPCGQRVPRRPGCP